jgi:hypothetical protein
MRGLSAGCALVAGAFVVRKLLVAPELRIIRRSTMSLTILILCQIVLKCMI